MLDVIELPGETHEGRDNVLEISGISQESAQELTSLVTASKAGDAYQVTVSGLDEQELSTLSRFTEQYSVIWRLEDIDRITLYVDNGAF